MLGTSTGSLLGLVTLFFNRTVINNLENYQPEYLPASYYFFYNLSDPEAAPRPVEEDEIYYESTLFPRCCQPGTVYDADNRGCVPVEGAVSIHDELNITVNLIQSGLVDCTVVVDRFVQKSNLKLRDGDATLKIGNEIYTRGQFCVDNVLNNDTVYIVRYYEEKDYCVNVSKNAGNEWCVHKCCIDGFQLENYRCVLNDRMGIHVKNNSDTFERTDGYAMLLGPDINCERTNWNEFRDVEPLIQANGNLVMGHSSKEYLINDYCLATNYDTTTNKISDVIISCEFREALYPRWIFIRVVIVITCVSFAIVLIVYTFVYRLKKLFEQIVTCFSMVELVFWCMYSMRIYDVRIGKFCGEFAYMYFFITMSRLSWLNIISYEIWRTICFLTTRNIGQTRQVLRKRMICYALYAVLIPTTATLAFILGNRAVYPLPTRFKPLIHRVTCSLDIRGLEGNLGHLHLYIPLLILSTINIVLFIKTALYILKTKKDLRKISNSNSGDKLRMDVFKRGFVILKLGLVMALSSCSYCIYFYVTTFNINKTLQRVFDIISYSDIFEGILFLLVFLVKWDILKLLSNRVNILTSNFFHSQSSNPASSSKMKNQVDTCILATRIKVT